MHGRKDTQYDRLLAFELGADDYFGRPFQPDVLARRVALHLDALARARQDEQPMRSPLDTIPDLAEIDRQQVELLRAEENKRDSSARIRANAPGPVLIVEDDKDIRDSISHLLEDEGIPTLTASNGEEALEVMRTSDVPPSIVLLDLMMPVMNGWEFRKKLESDRSLPCPKLVVVSAMSPDAAMGDAVWLRKPLGVDELLSTVQELTAS
jgi:DNA-binding response OmpR family regulator